jgi:hypothetical protein
MQVDKSKNAKESYLPVQIREEENEELQEKDTYRGTDREKITTNEEDADKKKHRRLEDENDRQKCRLIQRKEEETFMRKGGGGNAR